MPIIIVEPLRWSRSPIQSFFLILIAITGMLYVFGLSDNSVILEMGEPWYMGWGIGLVVGSVIALIGSYWPNRVDGMLIERSGIFLLGGASALWPILIVVKLGWLRSPFTVVSVAIFAMTCFLQVRYINKHINLIMDAITKREESADE